MPHIADRYCNSMRYFGLHHIAWRMRTSESGLSKIQSDSRVWLGTAYEDVPVSGPLERFRVVSNRSANQTSHAGMTDSRPARPPDRNIARFRQFEQGGEFRIPRGSNPATRE